MTNDRDDTAGSTDGPEPVLIMPAARPRLLTRLRNYFLTGIVVTAPISLTIYLTWELIGWIDHQVTPLLPARYNPETYLPFSLPGLGLVIMVVCLTFIGFLTANIFGRTLIGLGERLVNRMPVIRSVYNALKQILETVLKSSSQSFRQVVMVEYPRRDIWALAFVTADSEGEIARKLDDNLVNIFVPTTPNPTSGFLLVVPRRDIVLLDMSVEDAAKFIISAGVILPPDNAPAGAVAPPAEAASKALRSRDAGSGEKPQAAE